MVYLDVIDFLHGAYRLHRALKPGGTLFLYGYDPDPGWRASPYGIDLKRWMWNGFYAPEEVARMLEAHGYFEVLEIIKFPPQERPAQPGTPPDARPPYDYVVIARKPAPA